MVRRAGCACVLLVALAFAAPFSPIPPRPDIGNDGDVVQKSVTVTPGVTDGHAFQYHDYDGLTGFVQQIAVDCSEILRAFSIGQSVQGRELWTVRITDNPDIQEDEPEFLYVANMHGDETVGREVLIHMIQEMCDGYGTDDYTTALVDSTDMYFLITMNPDGFERKWRYNNNYVDLNRNFPDQFETPTTATAVETQAVRDFVMSHTFTLGANMHGGTIVCNYPWDGKTGQVGSGIDSIAPDNDLYIHLCLAYSEAHLTMHDSAEFADGITNGAHWYTVFGGLQDYSYVTRGMLHVTLELSHIKFVAESELSLEWANNHAAVYRFLEQVHRGVRGVVQCSCNTLAEAANATLQFVNLNDDTVIHPAPAMQVMTTYTDPVLGDYHRVLLPGTYTVTVEAEGCEAQSATTVVVPEPDASEGVTLIETGAVRMDFTLAKLDCPTTPSPSPSPASASPSPSPVSSSPSPSPSPSPVTICLTAFLDDTYGDGWNGASLFLDGTQDVPQQSVSLDHTPPGQEEVCVAPGEYAVYVCGGEYPEEAVWSLGGTGLSGQGETAATVSCAVARDNAQMLVIPADFAPSPSPSPSLPLPCCTESLQLPRCAVLTSVSLVDADGQLHNQANPHDAYSPTLPHATFTFPEVEGAQGVLWARVLCDHETNAWYVDGERWDVAQQRDQAWVRVGESGRVVEFAPATDECQISAVYYGGPDADPTGLSPDDCENADIPGTCTAEHTMWIGDGYCDGQAPYNTAECGYDGGDCCEASCPQGELLPGSTYVCGTQSDYACLDPQHQPPSLEDPCKSLSDGDNCTTGEPSHCNQRCVRVRQTELACLCAPEGYLPACEREAEQYTYTVLNAFPHDTTAFTQGLEFSNGVLYESTGIYGSSQLRRLNHTTGAVLAATHLDSAYFGEGLTIYEGWIVQVTWQSRRGFVYNEDTLEPVNTFSFSTQGWGLANDGEHVFLSDGSATIYVWNRQTLRPVDQIVVKHNGQPVNRLNELEYFNGLLWANRWYYNTIYIICPSSGTVVGTLDMSGLLQDYAELERLGSGSVLNGIAYDDTTGRLYVTGKRWPLLFEIEVSSPSVPVTPTPTPTPIPTPTPTPTPVPTPTNPDSPATATPSASALPTPSLADLGDVMVEVEVRFGGVGGDENLSSVVVAALAATLDRASLPLVATRVSAGVYTVVVTTKGASDADRVATVLRARTLDGSLAHSLNAFMHPLYPLVVASNVTTSTHIAFEAGCGARPCSHGECVADGTFAGFSTCACPDGYYGVRCGIPIRVCGSRECVAGVCVGGSVCDCDEGFQGESCELEVRPCSSSHCRDHGTCTERNGVAECACEPGWSGDRCDSSSKAAAVTGLVLVSLAVVVLGGGVCWVQARRRGGRLAQSVTNVASRVAPALSPSKHRLEEDEAAL